MRGLFKPCNKCNKMAVTTGVRTVNCHVEKCILGHHILHVCLQRHFCQTKQGISTPCNCFFKLELLCFITRHDIISKPPFTRKLRFYMTERRVYVGAGSTLSHYDGTAYYVLKSVYLG